MFENTDVIIERNREEMTNKVFSQIKDAAKKGKTCTTYTTKDGLSYEIFGSILRTSEALVGMFLNDSGYTLEEKPLEDGFALILEIDWSKPKPSDFDNSNGYDDLIVYPTAIDIYPVSMQDKRGDEIGREIQMENKKRSRF